MRWERHVAHRDMTNTRCWSESPQESPHGRHGCRWEDNIKMDLKVTGTHLAQDRDQWWALENRVINLQVS
jgi:hypothetical protein